MQYVGFINRGDFTAAFTRRFKGDTGNALDLKAVINFGIKGFFVLTAAFTAFWLSEIDPAGQLAHAQDIETVSGDIGAQRAKCFQSLIQFRRTQVTE